MIRNGDATEPGWVGAVLDELKTMKGLPWSDAEKAALRELWLAGKEIAVIAATLGRSRSGSSAMAEKLGLPPRGYSKRVKPIQLRRV